MAEVPPHLRTRLADMLAGGPSTANSSLADMAALRPSWETNATPLSRMAEAYQGAEARSYSPSFSERVGNSLQDLFMAGGMQPYPAGHLGRSLRDLAQISPLGVPMAVGDFQHARQQGDTLGAVLNAAAFVPGSSAMRSVFRRTQTASPDTGQGIMMFADDLDSIGSYGQNLWKADLAEIPNVADAGDPKLRRDVYRAMRENYYDKDMARGIADYLNPPRIVDSAGTWDADASVINTLYEKVFEPRGINAVRTADGAIVFDPSYVKRVPD